jgi:hypothetical protein
MNALNLLLLRLFADQPGIILNSVSPSMIGQMKELCTGCVLSPVKASVQEMQSVVFVISGGEDIPPFSFPDISNVWIENGIGYIQFRKIRKSFRIKESLAKIFIEFKDARYWEPDFSFCLFPVKSDSETLLKGIQDRLDFLNADKRFGSLDDLNSRKNESVRSQNYEEASNLRDEEKELLEELTSHYQEKFGS